MEDLKPDIDQAILDIRDRNYGLAEQRLFKFLDTLDVLERELRTHREWVSKDTRI